MSTPCFEDQIREKLKITPAMSKAFMERGLDHLRSGKNTQEALQAVADETGLKPATVAKVMQSDKKLFSLVKDAFSKQNLNRSLTKAAKQLVSETEKGAREKGIQATWDGLRRVALFGHGGVFPFTHLRNLLYGDGGERQIFREAVKDAYRYRSSNKGAALHEMDMALLKSGDYYEAFRTSGLDIGEGVETGDQLLKGMKDWSARSFDALKVARYKLMDKWWSEADPELKQGTEGKAYMELLARDANYATGAIKEPRGASAGGIDRFAHAGSKISGNVLLASKLFWARRMEGLINPMRYASQYLIKGGRMTPVERAVANRALKRWARTAVTQVGIVSANYAFAKAMGLQTPNMTDPNKPDFMRLRVGNFVVPLSPLWEILKEPIRAVATGIKTHSAVEGAKVGVAKPLVNALHPSASFLAEQITGKEVFSGRPVPSLAMAMGKIKKSSLPSVSAAEYIGGKTPILISGGVREFYQALRDEGMHATMASAIVKSMTGMATSGLAGTHIYSEAPQELTKSGNPKRPPESAMKRNPKFRSGLDLNAEMALRPR